MLQQTSQTPGVSVCQHSSSLLMSLQLSTPDDQGGGWVGWGSSSSSLIMSLQLSTPDDQGGVNGWGCGVISSSLVMSLQLSTPDDQWGVGGSPPHWSCHFNYQLLMTNGGGGSSSLLMSQTKLIAAQ